MIFEFLITYRRYADDIDIAGIICDSLAKVLEDNLNQFDADAVVRMVIPRLERLGDEAVDEKGETYQRVLFGFALDLPEETESPRIVVDEFVDALNTAPGIHLVKFEDPLLHSDLAKWAEEIYVLEMKLRRVLTLVYLHAYQNGDPYDLLHEECVKLMSREKPNAQHMKSHAENQFFHLTFGQYVELNKRADFKLQDLLELVRNKEAYDSFRDELSRTPVNDEVDVVLLAGLRERMDAIEAMRNCCAHNRRPSKKVEENYINVRPLLDQLLDDYLVRWELQEPIEEMLWDQNAREAVEEALEGAHWDEDDRTITFPDANDDRITKTVTSREELEAYLCEVANTAFYTYAPREDGEFVFECDDDDIVWTALEDYEDRLEDFFDDDDGGDS